MSGLTLLLTVVVAVLLALFISHFLTSTDDGHEHDDVDPEVDYDAVSVPRRLATSNQSSHSLKLAFSNIDRHTPDFHCGIESY